MRVIQTLACAALVALPLCALAADGVIRLSEPVESTADYEVFGSKLESSGEPMSLSALIAKGDEYSGKEVLVKTRVAKVCQKKGCFFIAQDGEAVARVKFKDYGFFVPTDTGGKTVTLLGTFSRTMVPEDRAKHYAEDAGEDPGKISGPQPEYSIVATSVKIPRARS